MANRLTIEDVRGSLPADLAILREHAAAEGYGFLERLADQWSDGAVTFEAPGEALLVARFQDAIAGVGGITVDPFDPEALRMRRFYVHPVHRRRGVAQTLATALIRDALKTGRPLYVNAGTAVAPDFWEKMGFIPVKGERHSHTFAA